MAAGEKMEMTVSATSHKVTTVKEMWYLVGSVEGINKKELLLECEIMAEFVDPKIEVSSSVIEFRYDYGPYSEYYKLTGFYIHQALIRPSIFINIIYSVAFQIL